MIRAEIITIGDEILIGQIIDSNSAWIAQELNNIGISVIQITSISDQRKHIVEALDDAKKRAEVILITGGLGPTKDDITKKVLADYFSTDLIHSEQVLEDIKTNFVAKRKTTLNHLNVLQAEVPASCEIIRNHLGTAPGMLFDVEDKFILSMPGVPYEMKGMMEKYIIPKLRVRYKTNHIIHKTVLVRGIPESQLAIDLNDWEEALPSSMKLAYLPSPGIIRLRFSMATDDPEKGEHLIQSEIEKLFKIIPDNITGVEEDRIEKLIGRVLKERGLTFSTAESCTGGHIASLITSVPGSSEYYLGSVVAYQNDIKEQILGVSKKSLIENGAVSRQVVEEMAKGIRSKTNSDYAVATSGIAGPTGGTEEKPVGTVWIAVASRENVLSQMYVFGREREINIKRSSATALNMLLNMIYAEGKSKM